MLVGLVVGLLVYLVAVFHRSSLAVAGLAATERFDISASQLATFTMLQLLVYAGDADPGRAAGRPVRVAQRAAVRDGR